MKVFISWSGDTSRALAEVLRDWIPAVVQAAKPYFTPDDISKGSRWNSEISKELEASRVGIVCLTASNLDAPWIMFEAGSLAKNLEKSKVCPLLFGLDPADITGPLVQFQAARFEEKEVRRVVRTINEELGDTALAPDVLDSVFDMWWPKLEGSVAKVMSQKDEAGVGPLRPERDILEEILALTRTQSRPRSVREFSPTAIGDLVTVYKHVVQAIEAGDSRPLPDLLARLAEPIQYIARRSASKSRAAQFEESLEEARHAVQRLSVEHDSGDDADSTDTED